MTRNNQDYEIYILTKAINNHLDEVVEFSEDGLNSLLSKHDEMVWKIATKIYTQSGYKVEFYFIRDVVNSWIEVLKQRIAAEKVKRAEQARLQAERQAERQAEQAQIEAEQLAEKARLQAKQAQIEAKRLAELAQISISDLFIKVQPLISEQLSVELGQVTLSSHISNELNADEFDIIELLMALEEEFDIEDIEIPFEYSPVIIGTFSSYTYSSKPVFSKPLFSHPYTCTVREFLEYIRQQLSNKYLTYVNSHPSLRQNNE